MASPLILMPFVSNIVAEIETPPSQVEIVAELALRPIPSMPVGAVNYELRLNIARELQYDILNLAYEELTHEGCIDAFTQWPLYRFYTLHGTPVRVYDYKINTNGEIIARCAAILNSFVTIYSFECNINSLLMHNVWPMMAFEQILRNKNVDNMATFLDPCGFYALGSCNM